MQDVKSELNYVGVVINEGYTGVKSLPSNYVVVSKLATNLDN